MDLILEPRDGFLLAIVSGEQSLIEAMQVYRDVCDVAAGLGLRKILFDCLAVEGDFTADERFELGKTIAEYGLIRLRVPSVALIGKPPSITGLGARIAANRGMPVEMFADRERGLEWLQSRP